MTTFKGSSGLTEPDKKVLPMSSDRCYPSLRYVHPCGEGPAYADRCPSRRSIVPTSRCAVGSAILLRRPFDLAGSLRRLSTSCEAAVRTKPKARLCEPWVSVVI